MLLCESAACFSWNASYNLKSCLFTMALMCPSANSGVYLSSPWDQQRSDFLAGDMTNTRSSPLPFHTSYLWRESWDLTPVRVWWNRREAVFVKGVIKLVLLVKICWSIILTLLIGKLVQDLFYIIFFKNNFWVEERYL